MRTVTLILLLAVGAGCASPVADGDGTYAIRNATLIDGTGGPPRPNTTIVFEGGRISQIGDADAIRLGSDATSVDATGQWIVPGFVDTHAHLPGPSQLEGTLQQLLNYGITAARTTASVTDYGVDVRDRIAAGELKGPTYRVAGALLDGPGSPWGFAAIVASPDEAREEVRVQAQAGVDYIKLYTLLPPDVVEAAIDEAHTLDLEVIGHIGRTSWFEAIGFGIDALTHSAIAGLAQSMVKEDDRPMFDEFFIPNADFNPDLFGPFLAMVDTETVRRLATALASNAVVLDPNLVLMEAVIRGDDPSVFEALMPEEEWSSFAVHPYSAGWSTSTRAQAIDALRHFFAAVKEFHDAGALITAGTDIGNPWMTPGVSFHRELELLVEAGLDEQSVLRVATLNGARAIGLAAELGTVEVGKRADVVVLRADPLSDIRNTAQIVSVYQAGRVVGGG